eukprot:Nitzschia sp. Nitz4//scaffold306_size21755//8//3956//NITZ4_008587-RA/size21755-snap-gene-0.14-mRNA-1//-1//CDS//3329547105//8790//frame0
MGSDSTRSEEIINHDEVISLSENSRNDQSHSSLSEAGSSGTASGSTTGSGSFPSGGSVTDGDIDEYVAKKSGAETLSLAKIVIIGLLLSLSAVTSWLWWKHATDYQESNYETEFTLYAGKIIETFHRRVEFRIAAAQSLATSFSAEVNSTSGLSFPFVTYTNFARRVATTSSICQAASIWWSPFIDEDDRPRWEEYASDNFHYWVSNASSESAYQTDDNYPYRLPEWPVDDGMYQYIAGQVQPRENVTRYSPIWQSYPTAKTAPWGSGITMFDQTSEEQRNVVLSQVIDSATAVFSEAFVSSTNTSLLQGHLSSPFVSLYAPIFASPYENKGSVAASLTLDMPWETFWDGAIDSKGSITLVLENTCDQAYIFDIVPGAASTFREYDLDIYNNKIDISMASSYEDFMDLLEFPSEQSSCLYRIHLHPTEEFEAEYLTNRPKFSAIGIGTIYLVTAAVFLVYDYIVQARQKKVIQSVKRSSAILKSLFPAGFRNRLLQEDPNQSKFEKMLPKNFSPLETHKMRLRSYLAPNQAQPAPKQKRESASGIIGSEPIAEFFAATTIMYADLSGFTAWSSTREPAQVFTLLETLYGTMDKIARRLGVFKVETIGDCYVAATGIPDPRPDHAVLMAKFSITCLAEIKELTWSLESQLGPGTGDLAFRIGLHSGPVTAGVLRGEKSRFQLFGDTMTTASRMESTGKAGLVQVSQATADLLIAGGKEDLLGEKSNVLLAKGKGEVSTYWLKPPARKSRRMSASRASGSGSVRDLRNSINYESDGSGHLSVGMDGSLNGSVSSLRDSTLWGGDRERTARLDRLVDYNADVLVSLLKKIVARRSVVHDFDDMEHTTAGIIAMDEVREVIHMPEYNQEAAVKMASDYTVKIPETVKSEMREYVRRIALMYQHNPFHNFEHASHVALSANKLMKRIVMPEEVDYRRDGTQKVIEKMLAVAKDLHLHTLGISSDPVAQFAVVFSALIHDVDHPGVPNFVLAKEEPDVAEKYRNTSIAEQRSVDVAWGILMENGFENLRQCMFPTQQELKHFRQLVVNTVLATDIFDKELGQLRKARWQKCFHPDELGLYEEDQRDALSRKATIVIEHIIQASDVAHTMQHWHVYLKWNERLFTEMCRAYKSGRTDKNPAEGWYKGEIWFFDNYVIPLAHKLKECGVFGVSSAEYLQYATENRDEWEQKGKAVCERMLADFEESEWLKDFTSGGAEPF